MSGGSELSQPFLGRDLDAARRAYENDDQAAAMEASRAAHNSVAVNGLAVEHHEQSGGRVKGIVFGGLDGILTSFAILAGSVGANLAPMPMLAIGVSNVLADALAMGVGEWISSRSYNNYVRKEREREAWEMTNYPAGEIAEMIELFVSRGMSREDAEIVIQRMAKYKDFFVDLMMTEELSLPVPGDPHEDSREALADGLTMFVSFTIFGMLPILGFFLTRAVYPTLEAQSLFYVACSITAVSLFGLGAFKARFHDKRYVRSGIETLLLGGACAAVAFFVGKWVSASMGVSSELLSLVTQPFPVAPSITEL